MSEVIPSLDAVQADHMHAVYLSGGAKKLVAPQVIYQEAGCPHVGCDQKLHAIDFRLEAFGRTIHVPLVRAWWEDIGFAGRCPTCGEWIHFTIPGKQAIDEAAAQLLPQLPLNWADEAVIL
jgi:hypothetical protein